MEMTLDEALEALRAVPSYLNAEILTMIATEYYADGMIGEDSYNEHTREALAVLT